MPARFGTDGVRGVANEELTAELALALGRATARILPAPTFVVGRDTRLSGPLLQAAFSAGLATEGADVIDLGVLPTPGVATVAAARAVPGAVISASHNPYGDNGIKLFSLFGTKLPVEVENEIERELAALLADPERPPARPTGLGVGRLSADPEAAETYVAHLVGTLGGRRLDGLRVVVDCANGAASAIAPRVLAEVGASVTALHDAPDGVNINDGCGSTDPSELAHAVVTSGADLGLALDGDADRVIAVDSAGDIVDGDVLLALFALDLAGAGRAGGEHGRGDGHDESRVPAGHGGAWHRGARDRRGGPPRAGRPGRGGTVAGGRTVGPHHLPPAVDDRRRRVDGFGSGRPHGAPVADARRAGRRVWWSGCRSAWSTCPWRSRSAWPTAPRCGRPS